MTTFTTQTLCRPVIGSMVAKDKGDLSNRTKCAKDQVKNNLFTSAQTLAVGGSTYGVAKFVGSNPARISKVAKTFDKIVGKLPQNNTLVQKLLKLPGKAKAAAIIILPAVLAVDYIVRKHSYKMGQIDQKYTDQAKIEEHSKDMLA